jgi:hypothetical protein
LGILELGSWKARRALGLVVADLWALGQGEFGPSVRVCESCMGDVGIGGIGGVEGDNPGPVQVLDLFEIRQADVVYQITVETWSVVFSNR